MTAVTVKKKKKKDEKRQMSHFEKSLEIAKLPTLAGLSCRGVNVEVY